MPYILTISPKILGGLQYVCSWVKMCNLEICSRVTEMEEALSFLSQIQKYLWCRKQNSAPGKAEQRLGGARGLCLLDAFCSQ